MKKNILIRKATIEDIDGLLRLNRESLGYTDISLEDTKSRFLYIERLTHHQIYIACIDDINVGYIHIQDYDTLFMEAYIEVLALCVLKDYQGYGIGKALLNYIEMIALENKRSYVRLGSNLNRIAAHAFYEHCGYTCAKTHRIFHKKVN